MRPGPEISVLLPVRDARPFLEDCLRSLERQTCSDFEVVAVDDGSRDGSEELLRARARRDRRLRIVRIEREGLITALNRGLEVCRGELIARLDADDLAHPRRLELQRAALRADPDLDVVSCLVRHFPRRRVGGGFRIYERWLNGLVEHDEIVRDRFVESPVAHPSLLARRAALLDIGGYRDRGWPEDYDLVLRLAAAGARFAKVPRVLHLWRQHPGRLTHTDRRYAVERFLACKAHHLAAGPLARAERVLVWGAGQTGRRLSKHLLRAGAPLEAFIDIDRRKIGRTLRGLPIRSADDLPRLLDSPATTRLLAAVSSRGARRLIRRRLEELGLRETADFWCAA